MTIAKVPIFEFNQYSLKFNRNNGQFLLREKLIDPDVFEKAQNNQLLDTDKKIYIDKNSRLARKDFKIKFPNLDKTRDIDKSKTFILSYEMVDFFYNENSYDDFVLPFKFKYFNVKSLDIGYNSNQINDLQSEDIVWLRISAYLLNHLNGNIQDVLNLIHQHTGMIFNSSSLLKARQIYESDKKYHKFIYTYSEVVKLISKGVKIIFDNTILSQVNRDFVIEDSNFDTMRELLLSKDKDNHKLAWEISSNLDVDKSKYQLLCLLHEFRDRFSIVQSPKVRSMWGYFIPYHTYLTKYSDIILFIDHVVKTDKLDVDSEGAKTLNQYYINSFNKKYKGFKVKIKSLDFVFE